MFDGTAKEFLEKTGIMEYLPDYRMNLFIPKAATEEELGKFETDLKYVMMYVRYSDDKNKLMNYARENNIVLNIESVTIINMLTNSKWKDSPLLRKKQQIWWLRMSVALTKSRYAEL
jgi:hypothetical protein